MLSMEVSINKLKIKMIMNVGMDIRMGICSLKNLKITPTFWYFVILNYIGKESLENSISVLKLVKNCHLMLGSLHNQLPSFER